MTHRLDATIAGLAGSVLDAAAGTPVAPSAVEALLPMEFGLRHGAEGWEIVARPPEATPDRRLAVPVGRLAFSLAIGMTEEGGEHG